MAGNAGVARRKRRSAQAWQGLVDGFAASGLSVAAYCQGEGVSPASFYRWRGLLGGGGEGGAAAGFVDLGTMQGIASAPGAAPHGSALEVTLDLGDGVVLHLVRG